MPPGPKRAVDGAFIIPPRYSLLSVAQTADDGDERFGNGIEFEPESCGGDVESFEACGDPVPEKPEGEHPGVEEYDAVTIVAVDQCSPFQQRDWRSRARRKLVACEAREIERQFWQGAPVATNPHLADPAANDISDAAITPAKEALAALEQELGQCQCGGQGVIHMTRRMAALLCAEHLIGREAGQLVTCLGSLVAAGSGYDGSSPAGAAPTGGLEYMYATGQVQVRLSSVRLYPTEEGEPELFRQALNRSTNLVTVYAERTFTVSFDPCCHIAVEVSNLTV